MDAFTLTPLIIESYTGELCQGKYHGDGKLQFISGNGYEGSLVNGYMHGTGTFTWRDGSKYSGDFQNNKATGTGMYSWTNGCQYDGEVVNGLRSGKGRFDCAPMNASYSGQWKDGKMNGEGVLMYSREGPSGYSGDWRDGIKEGHGTMVYASGNVYEGGWKNNVKHGRGTMIWKDRNEEYSGEWENGLPNGYGVYTWKIDRIIQHQFPSHNRYEGQWLNGKRHGWGVFQYASGAQYEGEWKENMKHGKGSYVSDNGRRYVGRFENDRMVGSFPKFQNECPFVFRLKRAEEASEEESRLINSVVLRHIGQLRNLYQNYCNMGEKLENGSLAMTRLQLWRLLIDSNLRKQGLPLVEMNRSHSALYSSDTLFRSRLHNPHAPHERFILYDFLEALIQIGALAYGNCKDLSIHETGLAASFSHLIKNNLLPAYSEAEKREIAAFGDVLKEFKSNTMQEMAEAYQDRIFVMYQDLAKYSKKSLPDSTGDKTLTIRMFIYILKDYGFLESSSTLTIPQVIEVFASQLPGVSDQGCYNLEFEVSQDEGSWRRCRCRCRCQ
ncbi:uncharacterized protein BJ171DRAFT_433822 [Polychytrium aggregatum]|uniref:uncharacterized protein n=1 Tax=Polychytrium aggregatum TaxID=110093 RepID=UPI0022FECEA2|nr:uncharacterized protein BJ171DRAFT_433822 [Polychytrium aggregatum]KAI9190775.1 hypothetical protein BJ171DRAFT_433822 [Polychytrium aggregatum]